MQDHKWHSHKGEVLIYFPVIFQLSFPLPRGIKVRVILHSPHAGLLSNRISVEHLHRALYMKLSFCTSHNRLQCDQASGGDKQTSLIYCLISLLVSGWLSRRLKEHKIRENKL